MDGRVTSRQRRAESARTVTDTASLADRLPSPWFGFISFAGPLVSGLGVVPFGAVWITRIYAAAYLIAFFRCDVDELCAVERGSEVSLLGEGAEVFEAVGYGS
jgi:hypothetical protein